MPVFKAHDGHRCMLPLINAVAQICLVRDISQCFPSDNNFGEERAELVAMTTTVKYLGIAGLVEVLSVVRDNSACGVRDSRPAAVEHFLQVN